MAIKEAMAYWVEEWAEGERKSGKTPSYQRWVEHIDGHSRLQFVLMLGEMERRAGALVKAVEEAGLDPFRQCREKLGEIPKEYLPERPAAFRYVSDDEFSKMLGEKGDNRVRVAVVREDLLALLQKVEYLAEIGEEAADERWSDRANSLRNAQAFEAEVNAIIEAKQLVARMRSETKGLD